MPNPTQKAHLQKGQLLTTGKTIHTVGTRNRLSPRYSVLARRAVSLCIIQVLEVYSLKILNGKAGRRGALMTPKRLCPKCTSPNPPTKVKRIYRRGFWTGEYRLYAQGQREASLHPGIITVRDGDLRLLQNNYEKEKKAGDIAQSAKPPLHVQGPRFSPQD